MKHAIAQAVAENATDAITSAPIEEAHEIWWHEHEVWVAVAFFLFLLVALKWVIPPIVKGLDARAAKIRDQLEQAKRLREEAEALLAQYREQEQAKLREAQTILEAARKDAVLLRERAAEELKQALARRTAQAEEKIARAEADAIAALRRRMIEQAANQAREQLVAAVTSEAKDPALERAVQAINAQLGASEAPAKPAARKKRA
jgi:F-type H+-transporting ATPase subunit b